VSKLILLSIILFTVVAPMILAKGRSPKRVLRGVQIATALAVVAWAVVCLLVYPQLVPLE
jgi:hypothetical protein